MIKNRLFNSVDDVYYDDVIENKKLNFRCQNDQPDRYHYDNVYQI